MTNEQVPTPLPGPDVTLAIRADRLFDGERSQLVERPLLLLRQGRIAAVEDQRTQAPHDAEVLDFGDATILPGLIDSHVHLVFDAGPDPVGRLAGLDDDELLVQMRVAARRALTAGVTTVRDLGDRGFLALRLRDWFRDNDEQGPEILAAGPPLTAPGGHCHFLGGVVRGEAEIRRAVRHWIERGADVIKVMANGGVLTPRSDPLSAQFTPGELAALVEEAHRGGRPVTAHVYAPRVIASAVEAGVDGLEHVGFWTRDGVEADQRLIDEIAARGITVCTTFGLLPDSGPIPPAVQLRLQGMFDAWERLARSGARIVPGTDAGVGPPKPHDVLPYAVQQLTDLGLFRPDEALRAATSVSAEVCGVADRKGLLRAGMDADLLVVGGDPLKDLAKLRDVRAVFRAGTLVRKSW